MSGSVKKTLRDEYKRLKNAVEKMIKPKQKEMAPQLILQPVRNKKYLRGTHLR